MKKVKRLVLNQDFLSWKKGTVFEEYVFEKNCLIEENTASIYHDLECFSDKELKTSELESIINDPSLTPEQKEEKKRRKTFKERFDKATPKNLEDCLYYRAKINPLKDKIKSIESELINLQKKLQDIEKHA